MLFPCHFGAIPAGRVAVGSFEITRVCTTAVATVSAEIGYDVETSIQNHIFDIEMGMVTNVPLENQIEYNLYGWSVSRQIEVNTLFIP